MKKIILGGAASLLALSMISGCGNKEEGKKKEAVKSSVQEVKGEKNNQNNTDNKEQTSFKILETIKQFGGGTVNLNKEIKTPGNFYVSEKDGNVFLTIRDDMYGNYREVSGNLEKWQSISDGLENNYLVGQYPRGYYFFDIEKKEITSGHFDFSNTNNQSHKAGSVPVNDLYLVNTSEGEGFIIPDGNDKYSLYVDGEKILDFQDIKQIMSRVPQQSQFLYESKVYVDIKQKKMYFIVENTNEINQLDLETGKPLFVNGEMKKIEIKDNGSTSIIGDASGDLYVVQSGDNVTVSLYNNNLDLVAEDFEVPVQNPKDVAVSVTSSELHIWDMYSFEQDPTIELIRVSKSSALSSNSSKENSNGINEEENQKIVSGVLKAGNKKDKETFRSYLVNDFGDEAKTHLEEPFFAANLPSFEIVDIVKSDKVRSFTNLPAGAELETYNATISLNDNGESKRLVISVTLYKEKDGWKVLSFDESN
ncbi:hypothetical protein E2K98_12815 [Bacillus salipaludis]|uniref:Lipoprotein n=1 Tax=Bacillus salipaludis TaxID=2547811 RepID=A0A4R5VSU7_9BACI|nr:hypothetical protein [Bacillus salipaludis]TDK61765.1 hypothetical protein E2K98_12815 [Bacillus salipaludis]